MVIETLVVLLIVGAVAGWLAGRIMHGRGFGLVGNIAVGILGALVGSLIFAGLGVELGGGLLSGIVGATLGAVILLFVIGLVKRP